MKMLPAIVTRSLPSSCISRCYLGKAGGAGEGAEREVGQGAEFGDGNLGAVVELEGVEFGEAGELVEAFHVPRYSSRLMISPSAVSGGTKNANVSDKARSL